MTPLFIGNIQLWCAILWVVYQFIDDALHLLLLVPASSDLQFAKTRGGEAVSGFRLDTQVSRQLAKDLKMEVEIIITKIQPKD